MRPSTALIFALLPTSILAFPANRLESRISKSIENIAPVPVKRDDNDRSNNRENDRNRNDRNRNGNNNNDDNNNNPAIIVIGGNAGSARTTAAPSRATAPAGAVVEDPAAGEEDPAAGGEDPAAGGEDPAAGGEDPAAGGEDPAAGGEDPAAGGEDPAAGGEDPAAGGEDPAAGGEDPAAGEEDPAAGEEDPAAGEEAAEGEEGAEAGELELEGVFGTPIALQGGDIKQDVVFTAGAIGKFEYEFQGAAADELTVVENTTPAAPPAGFVAIEPNSFIVSLAASAGAGLTLSKIDYIFDVTNPEVAAQDITKAQVGKLCTETGTFIIDAALGELEFEAEENEVTLNLNLAATANGEWGIFLPIAAGEAAPVVDGVEEVAPPAGNETAIIAPDGAAEGDDAAADEEDGAAADEEDGAVADEEDGAVADEEDGAAADEKDNNNNNNDDEEDNNNNNDEEEDNNSNNKNANANNKQAAKKVNAAVFKTTVL